MQSACSSLQSLKDLITLNVVNSFSSVSAFYNHLSELNLTHRDHLRPNWDTYFMVSILAFDLRHESYISANIDSGFPGLSSL